MRLTMVQHDDLNWIFTTDNGRYNFYDNDTAKVADCMAKGNRMKDSTLSKVLKIKMDGDWKGSWNITKCSLAAQKK